MHQYKTEQLLNIDIEEAWNFFSAPVNLSLITPPKMDFKILSELTGKEISEGMKIDYTLKPLFGLRLHWQTEICKVSKRNFFTDRQTKGPYKIWEHTHTFRKVNGGVLMNDILKYQMPFGFVGELVHIFLVRKEIDKIFSYRKKVLENLFNKNGINNN